MNLSMTAKDATGLSRSEQKALLLQALSGLPAKRVLLLPPDITRFHSGTGYLTEEAYLYYTAQGAEVDVMPALGTHAPMTDEEISVMFGRIPKDRFFVHKWRTDTVPVGEAPTDFVSEVTEGLWKEPVTFTVNRRLLDLSYDLILSLGQVVPHEVIGMSSHAKNIFVGTGGEKIIHTSHMIGAVYGLERMMGRDHSPVRKIFDYGMEHFLADRPIVFVLTVATAPQGKPLVHGLFIGHGRQCLTDAVALAQKTNIDFVEHGLKKCVVYLQPDEYHSTWLGNKSIYRTRMAMADGGELIVLAPGVRHFGENPEADALIRKYGFRGRLETLKAYSENEDLRANASVAAHLIHGSTDGRFSITYAVREVSPAEVEALGFKGARYEDLAKIYDPEKLHYGYNTVNGEEIYYVPNPSIGLWINRETFTP